ncbi:MAG TPA: Rieske (2Fe-2S) protein [Polyangia bacterium]
MRGCTRRTFNLVLGGVAVELLACGSSAPTLTPTSGMVTLGFAQFPALRSPGGSAVVQVQNEFPIVVVRTSDSDAVALSATCTHAACLVDYDGRQIHCPCHDANFGLDGAVLGGPTSIPLPTYAAMPTADGIVVDLS